MVKITNELLELREKDESEVDDEDKALDEEAEKREVEKTFKKVKIRKYYFLFNLDLKF